MSDDATGTASTPKTDGGRQYHLEIGPGDVAPNVLLVGDPARARLMAERFDSIEIERTHREFVTLTGTHRGLRVSVIGTGISSANMEIALVEILACVDDPVLIRCGSCGALSPQVGLGDLVISSAAVRMEGTSSRWVEPGYPAVAHHEVSLALIAAARKHSATHHVGVTATADGFYGAQGRPFGDLQPLDVGRLERLTAQGVLNLEMEISCLLTLASIKGLRAGAVCAVYATRHDDAFTTSEQRDLAEARMLDVGLDAMHVVRRFETERGEAPYWSPD